MKTGLDKAIEAVERRRRRYEARAESAAARNENPYHYMPMAIIRESVCDAILSDLRAIKEKEEGDD